MAGPRDRQTENPRPGPAEPGPGRRKPPGRQNAPRAYRLARNTRAARRARTRPPAQPTAAEHRPSPGYTRHAQKKERLHTSNTGRKATESQPRQQPTTARSTAPPQRRRRRHRYHVTALPTRITAVADDPAESTQDPERRQANQGGARHQTPGATQQQCTRCTRPAQSGAAGTTRQKCTRCTRAAHVAVSPTARQPSAWQPPQPSNHNCRQLGQQGLQPALNSTYCNPSHTIDQHKITKNMHQSHHQPAISIGAQLDNRQ